jgi:hypothetical protein
MPDVEEGRHGFSLLFTRRKVNEAFFIFSGGYGAM